jgi:lipid-A-disaccharide synthase-like uncharacterized protein
LARSQIEFIPPIQSQRGQSSSRFGGDFQKKLLGIAAGAVVSLRMDHFAIIAATPWYHITLTPWKIVGLVGSAIFGLRFLIQWIASERARRSVIPVGFWECSALGSILTLSYFIIYRHDSVGILQTALPLPIYLRNLYFRWTHHHAQHPGNEPRPPE